MEPTSKKPNRNFKGNDIDIQCRTDEYGWNIQYISYYNGEKDRKYEFTIGYNKLPVDSSNDFVLGYCRCELIHRDLI